MTCFGQEETVKTLLTAGAEVNSRSHKGWTALIPVARHGYTHIARMLVNNGIDVNAATDRGRTALQTAVFWNNLDTARALLDAGANPIAMDHDGESILECALRNAGNETFQLVRERCTNAAPHSY